MVSLRKRLKADLIASLENRTSKMPIVLDRDDFNLHVERGVRKLNDMLFNPRSVLLTNAANGLLDVTAFHMDEVTNVYYSQDTANNLLAGMDLGIGLLPLVSSPGMFSSSLESMIDFLILKNVTNMLQRKMQNATDYTLLPLDVNGHQYLQVQNPGNLFWVEYLTYINPDDSEWDLYENEFLFLLELCYAYICHAHTETLAQVSILGAGKEAVQLLQYWDKKIEDIIKAFQDSSLISYIG